MSMSYSPQAFTPAQTIGMVARELLDNLMCGRAMEATEASAMLRDVLSFAIEADQRLISAQSRLEALEQNSTIDPLTSLASEAGLKTQFSRCAAAASRYGEPGVMLLIEVADLQDLRCTPLRPGAMDSYQRSLAAMLVRQIRTCDTAGRLGEGQFIALLERCPITVADKKARMLARAMAGVSVVYGDRRIESPMRVGWAPFSAGSTFRSTMTAARHCLTGQAFNVTGLN